jgi:BirA family biotin operon repressor/biotin-[acetyl-CoA-carboxylase] ligase
MDTLYSSLLAGESLFPRWRAALGTIGKRVTVTSGDQVIQGTAEDVADDGSLLLRSPDGALHHITIGDVSLRE